MRCIITQKKKKKRKHKRDEYRRRILNIIVGARNSNSVHFEVFARLGDTQLNRPRLFYFIYMLFFDVVESKLDENFFYCFIRKKK